MSQQDINEARAHAEWLDAGKNAVSPERQRLLLQVLVAVTTRPSRHIDTDADQPSSSGRLSVRTSGRSSKSYSQWPTFAPACKDAQLSALGPHVARRRRRIRNQSVLEFLEVTLSTAQSTALTIKEEDSESLHRWHARF